MPLHFGSDHISKGYLSANYFTEEKIYGKRAPSLHKSKYPNKIDIFAGSSRYFALISTKTNSISVILSWMATHFYIVVTCHEVSFSNRFSTGSEDSERFTGNIKLEFYSNESRSYAMVVFKPSRLKDETNPTIENNSQTKQKSKSSPKTTLICPNGFSLNSIQSFMSRTRNIATANVTSLIKSEISSSQSLPQTSTHNNTRINLNRFTVSPRSNTDGHIQELGFTDNNHQFNDLPARTGGLDAYNTNSTDSLENQLSNSAVLNSSSNSRNQIIQNTVLELVNRRSSAPTDHNSRYNFLFRNRDSCSSLQSLLPLYEHTELTDQSSNLNTTQIISNPTDINPIPPQNDTIQPDYIADSQLSLNCESQDIKNIQNYSQNPLEVTSNSQSNINNNAQGTIENLLESNSKNQNSNTFIASNTTGSKSTFSSAIIFRPPPNTQANMAINTFNTTRTNNDNFNFSSSYDDKALSHNQTKAQNDSFTMEMPPNNFLDVSTTTPPAYEEVDFSQNQSNAIRSRMASLSAPSTRNGEAFDILEPSASNYIVNSSQNLASSNVHDIMSLVIANAGTNTQRKGRTRLDLEPTFKIGNNSEFSQNYKAGKNSNHSTKKEINPAHSRNKSYSFVSNEEQSSDNLESYNHPNLKNALKKVNTTLTKKIYNSKSNDKRNWYSFSRPVSRSSVDNSEREDIISGPQLHLGTSLKKPTTNHSKEATSDLESSSISDVYLHKKLSLDSDDSPVVSKKDKNILKLSKHRQNYSNSNEPDFQASDVFDSNYYESLKQDKIKGHKKDKRWTFTKKISNNAVTFADDEKFSDSENDNSLSKQIKKVFVYPWKRISLSNRSTPTSSCLVTPSHSRKASISSVSEVSENQNDNCIRQDPDFFLKKNSSPGPKGYTRQHKPRLNINEFEIPTVKITTPNSD
ncbi:hypothetical protein BB561_001687 [Smittium simulii]|uniref:Uncharacterized protein n=1 Tax=Smittium simulii TaxID=133385 RepID=A0A2T9YTH6_9FUNG|nr:hypothetical protein BB561_001687 [Smittium simulii]